MSNFWHWLGRYKNGWMLVVLLALAPLWMLGMFDRGYWTPDEPREADIAWRMSVQADHTLPHLADRLFLEKPPLSYWLSAAAMRVWGDSAAAARAPNFVYALLTSLAIGWLVRSMVVTATVASANVAASVAAIAAGSMLTAYQVAIWLAPDACLMAGCALALLGAYRGYCAERSRVKLWWYLLMHAGALMGFMAKSALGWLAPGLALLALIAWEHRWRELKRWELWLGFLFQGTVIGAWLLAVLAEPQGRSALQILFWNNVVGRFTDLHASGALNYAVDHKNWPGKYLFELPYHVFPWTLLVMAALYRAWSATRIVGATGTPWRFATAACVPFFILLSFSTTARGIYLAPALLGVAMLVGLWAGELADTVSKLDNLALRLNRYAVGLFVLLMTICLGLMMMALINAPAFWILLITTLLSAAIAVLSLRLAARAQRRCQAIGSLGWAYVAFICTLGMGSYALLPIVDQWQDLQSLARSIKHDAAGHPLALLQPDETTIAMLDFQLPTPVTIISDNEQMRQWLASQPAGSEVLVNLPGHAAGQFTQFLNRLMHRDNDSTPQSSRELQLERLAHLVTLYQLPEGRRYALLSANPLLLAKR